MKYSVIFEDSKGNGNEELVHIQYLKFKLYLISQFQLTIQKAI